MPDVSTYDAQIKTKVKLPSLKVNYSEFVPNPMAAIGKVMTSVMKLSSPEIIVQSSYDFRIFFGELFALKKLNNELCSPHRT